MQKEPIIFSVVLLALIALGVYFIFQGFKTGHIYMDLGMKVNREEQPILFWVQVMFLTLLNLFLLIVLIFIIFHYFL